MPIGGILRSVVNPISLAQLAMGPAGWASLAMRTLGPQIGMNLIQRLGQQLNLPQPMIDLAQSAFANSMGQPGLMMRELNQAVSGFTNQMDLRPSEAGQLRRELLTETDRSFDAMERIVQDWAMRGLEEEGEGGASGAEAGGSVLMRIARALGQLMDSKMDDLAAKSDQLGRLGGQSGMRNDDGGFNAQGQSRFGQLSAEVQALSQEIGYLSQAISSTIKSIGEASETIARA
ncbi:MAG: hypothetical protein AAF251_08225 [Pseudomonadota bacterium]